MSIIFYSWVYLCILASIQAVNFSRWIWKCPRAGGGFGRPPAVSSQNGSETPTPTRLISGLYTNGRLSSSANDLILARFQCHVLEGSGGRVTLIFFFLLGIKCGRFSSPAITNGYTCFQDVSVLMRSYDFVIWSGPTLFLF